MQVPRIGQVVVLCVLVPGCSMYQNAARNIFEAPIDAADNCSFFYHNRQIAKTVWKDYCRANPDAGFSPDFARGFIDGYADYLDGGGKPREPAVPPWCYRRNGYLTPAGRQAVEDWYAGFRDGTAAAIAGVPGNLLRLPSSGAMLKSRNIRPRPAPPREPEPPPPDGAEPLPFPREERDEREEPAAAPAFWETGSGTVIGQVFVPDEPGPEGSPADPKP